MKLNTEHKKHIKRYALMDVAQRFYDKPIDRLDFEIRADGAMFLVLIGLRRSNGNLDTNWSLESKPLSKADAEALVTDAKLYASNIVERFEDILEDY